MATVDTIREWRFCHYGKKVSYFQFELILWCLTGTHSDIPWLVSCWPFQLWLPLLLRTDGFGGERVCLKLSRASRAILKEWSFRLRVPPAGSPWSAKRQATKTHEGIFLHTLSFYHHHHPKSNFLMKCWPPFKNIPLFIFCFSFFSMLECVHSVFIMKRFLCYFQPTILPNWSGNTIFLLSETYFLRHNLPGSTWWPEWRQIPSSAAFSISSSPHKQQDSKRGIKLRRSGLVSCIGILQSQHKIHT